MKKEQILRELQFKAVRSGGPGGQHANKVSTKVELYFNLQETLAVTSIEKERLLVKLAVRLTKENVLILFCDETRSQLKNREIVTKRFLKMVKEALKVSKKRKKTKPSRAAVESRLKSKKKHSQKKAGRGKPNMGD